VIPRGTHFAASIYALHHDETYFPDAETYNPERWLDEAMDEDAKRNMNYAFVPFSLGYRGCAGKTMAYMEVGLTIARTLWYFDFERASGEEGKLGEGGTPDAEEGRERASEFQMRDAFTATHEGPSLVFKTREDYWRELK
jgi:cytochrome P450